MNRVLWVAAAVMGLGTVGLLLPVFQDPVDSAFAGESDGPVATLPAPPDVPLAATEEVTPGVDAQPALQGVPVATPRFRVAQLEQSDRQRMGAEAYADLERLWMDAHRTSRRELAIHHLQQLVRRYPRSNRAGCATYELGRHLLAERHVPLRKRRDAALRVLEETVTHHPQARCGKEALASHLALLTMASEILPSRDLARAARVLNDLMVLPVTEVDDRGQPVATRARRILEGLVEDEDEPLDPEEMVGVDDEVAD